MVKNHHGDDLVNIAVYRLMRLDRAKCRGGGVCCYVRLINFCEVISTKPPSDPNRELMSLLIRLAGCEVLNLGLLTSAKTPL